MASIYLVEAPVVAESPLCVRVDPTAELGLADLPEDLVPVVRDAELEKGDVLADPASAVDAINFFTNADVLAPTSPHLAQSESLPEPIRSVDASL
jgi:hypothetical protein